jgi:hypothetical protein
VICWGFGRIGVIKGHENGDVGVHGFMKVWENLLVTLQDGDSIRWSWKETPENHED